MKIEKPDWEFYIRFFSKIKWTTTAKCWEWNGHLNSRGYGLFRLKGKDVFAHRVSYLFEYGELPDDMFVCHKCDNPKCIRPDHLFLGTQKDNMADCRSKGRNFWANKTHCIRGHKLSGSNIYINPSTGSRVCKECRKIHQNKHLEGKRNAKD